MHAKDFLRMFAYDRWANRECLAAMRAARVRAPGHYRTHGSHSFRAEAVARRDPEATPDYASVVQCNN